MRLFLIASTPYGFLHHRFQKLADTFRAMGVPVTYIEQTYGWRAYLSGERKGFVASIIRSLGYHILALASMLFPSLGKGKAQNEFTESNVGMSVFEMPLVIPTQRLDSPFVERLNAEVHRQVLRRKILNQRRTGEETVAIVDNPLWGLTLDRNDFSKIFYDCIDHLSLYAGWCSLERFQMYERRLIANADGVFVTAAKLEEHIRSLQPHIPVYRIPNGVDDTWFQEQVARREQPKDISGIKRPIVGYIGTISVWLDYMLVGQVARAFPNVSFVFVGPVDFGSRVHQLCTAQNILWLGKKDYFDVPLYIDSFDVCWIPFASGKITENTNPIKLFEYFALGKPVVTTRMPEVDRFSEEGLVYCGDDETAMIEAVRFALNEHDEEKRAKRLAVAHDHSWNTLVAKMKSIMAGGYE